VEGGNGIVSGRDVVGEKRLEGPAPRAYELTTRAVGFDSWSAACSTGGLQLHHRDELSQNAE